MEITFSCPNCCTTLVQSKIHENNLGCLRCEKAFSKLLQRGLLRDRVEAKVEAILRSPPAIESMTMDEVIKLAEEYVSELDARYAALEALDENKNRKESK